MNTNTLKTLNIRKTESLSANTLIDRALAPLVSVIMPVYNAIDTLEASIQSVLAQTYINWELLLVDDCSKDNSRDICKHYSSIDSRIKYIPLDKNRGAARARNIAISHSQGRFISFLDSDDLWAPEKLDVQINYMLKNDISFSCTAYKVKLMGGKYLKSFFPEDILNYNNLLRSNQIGCLTAVYDVEKLGKHYMPLLQLNEDYALWLHLLKLTKEAHAIPKTLATYIIRDTSVSSNKMKSSLYQWKIYRVKENIQWFKAAFYQMTYFFNGLIKYRF